MRKVLSYIAAAALGLLACAPPINYDVPLGINTGPWLYAVIASGLLAFFLLTQKINIWLKILIVYLFTSCFVSQAPSSSFNIFFLASLTLLFYLVCLHLDFEPIMQMTEAVFWLQVFFLIMQQLGMNTLTEFGAKIQWDWSVVEGVHKFVSADAVANGQHRIFFGTVFQPMRLGSLFAVMSPLLIFRNRWYIVPLLYMAITSKVLGFSLALVGGILVHVFLSKAWSRQTIYLVLIFGVACIIRSWPHIRVEWIEGRIPVWWVILKSWCFDTSANFHGFLSPMNPPVQTGPFDVKRFFFGHGMNTFLTLFPFFKYDPNPFPQAHNDWLQFLWELGIIGFSIFAGYCASILRALYLHGEKLAIACLFIIGINMFFHFPWYMTQSVLFMVAFAAYCERRLRAHC